MTQLSNSNINAVADLKPGYTLGAADVALLQEMARRLLATEAREPVAYMIGGHYLMHAQDPKVDNYASAVPLYATPPEQPVAVPDDVLKRLLPDAEKSEFWFEHDGKILFEGVKFNDAVFEACRAAMLNAEPVSQPYTLPQWIPCSERMPEVDTRVLLYFSDVGGHIEDGCIGDEGDGPYHYFFDGDSLRHEPTHWMLLPAAPQEPTK